MPNAPKIDRAHVISWLSEPRYSKYLEVTRGDDAAALDLYLWNTGLVQAVLKDVSFFEVALGNAYDSAISSAWSGSDHWLLDDASPARRPILRANKRGQVNDANRLNRSSINHLRNGLRENATADDIVSNLTLGFWAHMTDRSHERDLWIPIIYKAWPKGADRNDVNGRITGINKIRNRAAHHEHLFARAGCECGTLQSRRDGALLFAQLEPIAHSCVCEESVNRCSVDNYLEEHPAPCDVAV